MCHCQLTSDTVESDDEHEEAEEDEDEEYDQEGGMIVRAKWTLDGCATIDEVIARLQEQILRFRQLKSDGWEMRDAVNDDYGWMHNPSTIRAQRRQRAAELAS